MTAQTLAGKHVAMLLTDGVEEVEYTQPRFYMEERGASVRLVSPKRTGDQVQGFDHLKPDQVFQVEENVADSDPSKYDMLVLPGGVANPDMLRLSDEAVAFVRHFAEADKPIAAICHGPWMLINAGIVKGRRLTSWPTLATDLGNAGADWTDAEVVVDGRLITSRKPDDIPAFNAKIEQLLSATTS